MSSPFVFLYSFENRNIMCTYMMLPCLNEYKNTKGDDIFQHFSIFYVTFELKRVGTSKFNRT